MAETFESLVVWQQAMEMVTQVYEATKGLPRDEVFGLTSQLRRAAVSIPANIAEGKGRLTRADYRYFLGTARGSLLELRTHIRISQNLGYLRPAQATDLLKASDNVGRLLNGLLSATPDIRRPKGAPNS